MKTYIGDTEGTGLSVYHGDRPYMLSVLEGRKNNDGRVLTFDRPVDPLTREVDWSKSKRDLELIGDTLGNRDARKAFHNAPYDAIMVREGMGIALSGRVEDTSIAARICNTTETTYRLKPLAWKYFGFPTDDVARLDEATKSARSVARKQFPKWKIAKGDGAVKRDYWLLRYAKELGLSGSAEELYRWIIDYNIGDCFRCWLMLNHYDAIMDKEPLYRETYELELELMPIFAKMQDRGIVVSRKRLLVEKTNIEVKLVECYDRIRKQAGADFNAASPIQLCNYLYSSPRKGGLGLKPTRKTKKGNDSTDWKSLRPYWGIPFVWDIMQLKGHEKGVSILDGFIDRMVLDHDGSYRVHPNVNQAGTRTGRISSDFQQVPNPKTSIKGTDIIRARYPFRPLKDRCLPKFDYEQMELRLLAELADIDLVLDAIANGRDSYTDLANQLWGGANNQKGIDVMAQQLELGSVHPSSNKVAEAWREIEWCPRLSKDFGLSSAYAKDAAAEWLLMHGWDIVKSESLIGKSTTRQRCKFITLAKQYGGGVPSLMDLLFCTEDEADDFISLYDDRIPEVKRYIRKKSKEAEKYGFITTLYGRKLRVDEDRLYASVNYEVQGSCADLVKKSMRKIDTYLGMVGKDFHMLLQNHDELMFDAAISDTTKPILRRIKAIMEDTEGKITVPMSVEASICYRSWAEGEVVTL